MGDGDYGKLEIVASFDYFIPSFHNLIKWMIVFAWCNNDDFFSVVHNVLVFGIFQNRKFQF